jgi:hypothetical protein
MDPRLPPARIKQGPDRRGPNAELKVNLLIAYFQSGRDEIITRVGHRENALLLFMGSSAAIFGLAFGDIVRPMILFAIAPLGLGASLVLTQHNDVIGALGHYCGIEVTEQAEAILGDRCPDSWETSASLLRLGPRAIHNKKPGQLGAIPKIFSDRLYASLLLIAGPGAGGGIVAIVETPQWWVRLLGGMIDGLTLTWTVFLLWNSYAERTRRRNQIAKWRKARISSNAGSSSSVR